MASIEVDSLKPYLSELGFKKRSGGIFTLGIGKDFLGWLGLNRSTKHRRTGEVGVLPQIGVRAQLVERLVAEARGVEFHSYQPPTIVKPLGYLMPDAKARIWVFNAENAAGVAEDLSEMIEQYGVAFMKKNACLGELRMRMAEGFGHPHRFTFCQPAAALLDGDVREAERFLEVAISQVEGKETESAENVRAFVKEMRRRHS